jgi:mRNA interferase YafQ
MKKIEIKTKMKKDLKRIKKRKYDLSKLFFVVEKIQLGEPLDPKYKNHKLDGDYKDFYDLHIEPDWVLLYRTDDESVHLYRTGTHADLLEN